MIRPPLGVCALHERKRLLRAQERASEIRVHDRPPLLYRELIERDAWRADAGIVEQEIEPAESFLRPREERLHRLRIGDIGRHGQQLPCVRVPVANRLLEPIGPASGQHYGITIAGKRQRNGLPDATASTGDNGYLLRCTHASINGSATGAP